MSLEVDTVRVTVPCQCGETAVQEMTPDVARRHAAAVLAAADGLLPVNLDRIARGEG